MKNKIRFYITRLQRASFSEFIFRGSQALRHARISWLVRRGRLPCPIPRLNRVVVNTLIMPEVCGKVDHIQVERILAGCSYSHSAEKDDITAVEDRWRTVCSFYIDHARSPLDIRAVWEPARLQHVTILFTWLRQHPEAPERELVKEFARTELVGWLADNPFLHGPHYLSAIECALRVPVFIQGLKILDNLGVGEAELLHRGIFLHAWWIGKNLSLHSSLGNHTVCEAVGLVFAGALFRETETGRKWLADGIALLEQELDHQVLPDGGPVEQSFCYHRFVLDLYWLMVDFLENNNLRRCDAFKARLTAGERFLLGFGDAEGRLPAIGDGDDGHALAPGLSPHRIMPSLQEQRVRSFATSGYTVVRWSGGGLLTFDHGPLGMAPLYNHGHADALSITLSVGGIPFLVDVGTYRYNGVPSFRSYFKGTRAHNTVIIDGLDQAEQLTGFVWGDPFTAQLERLVESETCVVMEASHNGYQRLKSPVRHRRSVAIAADGPSLITDSFDGKGAHAFELNFHFHPEVRLSPLDGGWLAERDGRRVRIGLESGSLNLRRGEEAPPLGWFSPAYNVREPSPVLQACRTGGTGEVQFVTRLQVEA